MHFFRLLSILVLPFFFTPLMAGLGTVMMADPILGNRPIVYEELHGFAVSEGDIILAKLADLSQKKAIFTLSMGGSRWPNGMVPFEMSQDLPFMTKLAVMEAIAHWQEKTSIQFVELTNKNRHHYRSYISFLPIEGNICSSYVGMQGGMQEINLSLRCSTMNVVHEIGHALGLWHEQSRADRSDFIRILWENIEEKYKYNFNQHLTDGNDFGTYDYQSIMHYGPYTFSKNGQKTIVPLIDGVEIGQRKQLSEMDIAAIESMYSQAVEELD